MVLCFQLQICQMTTRSLICDVSVTLSALLPSLSFAAEGVGLGAWLLEKGLEGS